MGAYINTEAQITDKNIVINPDWLRYVQPFSMILTGNSMSGKTSFVFDLIDNINNIVINPPQEIHFLYSVDQPIYAKYRDKINFTKNVDILTLTPEDEGGAMIIIDDMSDILVKDPNLVSLFTKNTHHKNISVILILQNLFIQSPNYVTLRQNACYYGFTDVGMNLTALNIFASRLGGKEMSQYFKAAYKNTMKKKFQVLLLDAHPLSFLRGPPFGIIFRTNTNRLVGQVLFLPNK